MFGVLLNMGTKHGLYISSGYLIFHMHGYDIQLNIAICLRIINLDHDTIARRIRGSRAHKNYYVFAMQTSHEMC